MEEKSEKTNKIGNYLVGKKFSTFSIKNTGSLS